MSHYKHILVAIDFSATADKVLEKAIQVAQQNSARLSLLHVVEYMPPMDIASETYAPVSWEIDEEMLVVNSNKSLEALRSKYISDSNNLSNATLSTLIGTPKQVISQYVADNNCDLVILGSHGRHGISLLLGSTANAVLHDMPCDVLTVKIEE